MYNLQAVGSDPEFFLANQNQKPVPAIGLIGGSKHEPKFINDDGFSAVQEDNVMVEYNTKPAKTAEEFVHNHLVVQAYLDKLMQEKKLVPLIKPAAKFTKKDLDHEQAQQIGCSPDWNAWTVQPNVALTAKDLGQIRVSGGHVHVSYSFNGENPSKDSQIKLVRMLDLAEGVPSVLLDGDILRKQFYGRAGSFRPKTYGVEYRTLSNFWINSPELMKWVFNQVVWTFIQLKNNTALETFDEASVQKAINTNDKDIALKLIDKYKIPMPEVK